MQREALAHAQMFELISFCRETNYFARCARLAPAGRLGVRQLAAAFARRSNIC
jgi:hypothetical protein